MPLMTVATPAVAGIVSPLKIPKIVENDPSLLMTLPTTEWPRRVEKMLRVLHDLSVKPRKGRRKDLTRIGKATASLRKETGR